MCTSATRIGWTAKSQFAKAGEDFEYCEEWIYWEEAEGVAGGKRYWIRRVLVSREGADKNGEFVWGATTRTGS